MSGLAVAAVYLLVLLCVAVLLVLPLGMVLALHRFRYWVRCWIRHKLARLF